MDLDKIIRDLRTEKERLDRAIASLEDLTKAGAVTPIVVTKRRGRKTMGEDERKEVSARMREYWRKRKNT
ncbi:MAG TPA: hypothetical protein VFB63_00305 [Bryobacteraceae bacterium]|jgi:hypothetical protein|nr:hypothetical protein [Bryobacteraceae bacterium]